MTDSYHRLFRIKVGCQASLQSMAVLDKILCVQRQKNMCACVQVHRNGMQCVHTSRFQTSVCTPFSFEASIKRIQREL